MKESKMTDREMLTLAYGALKAAYEVRDYASGFKPGVNMVIETVEKHLFPPPPPFIVPGPFSPAQSIDCKGDIS
jgi:hypothetical protein